MKRNASSESDWYDMSESATWNVAQNYSQLMIMKHLYLINEYRTLATFGTTDMVDDFVVDEKTRANARVIAIKRMCHHLRMLVGNTYFAIKDKNDKIQFDEYKKALDRIGVLLNKEVVYYYTFNQRDKTRDIRVNEIEFGKILNTLVQIEEDANTPLNKASLIFKPIEEFDAKKIKDKIMEDLINLG